MRTLALVAMLAISGPALGQTSTTVRLTLADGSQVRGQLLCESVSIATPYGPLSVPAAEIRSIKFGIHVGDEEGLARAAKHLGSASHKERLAATHWLTSQGRCAVPVLRKAMKSPDLEVCSRAESIYAAITERDSGAALAPMSLPNASCDYLPKVGSAASRSDKGGTGTALTPKEVAHACQADVSHRTVITSRRIWAWSFLAESIFTWASMARRNLWWNTTGSSRCGLPTNRPAVEILASRPMRASMT